MSSGTSNTTGLVSVCTLTGSEPVNGSDPFSKRVLILSEFCGLAESTSFSHSLNYFQRKNLILNVFHWIRSRQGPEQLSHHVQGQTPVKVKHQDIFRFPSLSAERLWCLSSAGSRCESLDSSCRNHRTTNPVV